MRIRSAAIEATSTFVDLLGPKQNGSIPLEEELITRIEASANPEDEYDMIEDELYEDPEGMYGLDIGVASAVISLSAARCLPFSSCNAGAFGGNHHEWHPVVAFFSRPEAITLLLDCAKEANTGLNQGDIGNLVVYADDIRNIRAFARELICRSADFRRLRFSKSKERHKSRTPQDAKQLDLL